MSRRDVVLALRDLAGKLSNLKDSTEVQNTSTTVPVLHTVTPLSPKLNY